MDVLFINAQDALELRKEVNGQLILGTLLLQAGFDVDILRFCEIDGFKGDYELFIQNSIQKILSYEPKAVSFYSLWPDYHIMLRIARELKAIRPDIYTVFGGPQPSATAQETMDAMPYVDFICSGEGENTVVPFFTALLRNNKTGLDTVPGLYYREEDKVIHHDLEHPLCDINATPHWDDRLYLKHYNDGHENYSSKSYYMPIDAGRGCPFSCTFCCSSIFWKRKYRLKSAQKILSEINYYKNKFGIKSYKFSHDAFTVNKKLVQNICKLLINQCSDITWKCTSRIDCVDNELIEEMHNAGLREIEFGVESGSDRIQKCTNKNLNLQNAANIVEETLKHNIHTDLYFMYGFPTECESDIRCTLDLMFNLIDIGITYASMSLCRFFPKTKITDENYNALVFDTSASNLFRGYGTEEELEIIKVNKKIFTMYFNLQTPVRNKYKFLSYFIYLYRKYPITFKYIRQYYKSSLNLYEDLYSRNHTYFVGFGSNVEEHIKQQSYYIVKNLINNIENKYREVILDILEFENDLIELNTTTSDKTIINKYRFNYADIKSNCELGDIIAKSSILYIQKKDNRINIQSLST